MKKRMRILRGISLATLTSAAGLAQAAEQAYDVTYCLKSGGSSQTLVANQEGLVVSNFSVRGTSWANDPAMTKVLDGYSLDCIGVQYFGGGKQDLTGYCTWTSPDKGDYFLGRFSKSAADGQGKWEMLSGTGRFSQVTAAVGAQSFIEQRVAALVATEQAARDWGSCFKAAGKINMQ